MTRLIEMGPGGLLIYFAGNEGWQRAISRKPVFIVKTKCRSSNAGTPGQIFILNLGNIKGQLLAKGQNLRVAKQVLQVLKLLLTIKERKQQKMSSNIQIFLKA